MKHRLIPIVLISIFALAAVPAVATPPKAPAVAQHDVNLAAGMTLAGAPLAIHGYDPVAFFTEGKARLGDARHTVAHEGAAYRFVSEANRRSFERNPSRFLPQYGGFCAYGVSVGAKFDGDPRVFAVVDGKLYFNLNPEIQKTWEEDRAGNIRKADDTWPGIRTADPADLK